MLKLLRHLIEEYKIMGIKTVFNFVEGEKKNEKHNDFTCSLMAIATELMVINRNNNGLTHTIINLKKRK